MVPVDGREPPGGGGVAGPVSPAGSGLARLKKTVIRLVGPLILVVLVLRIGDTRAILSTLAGADLRFLAAALALNFACNHFKVLRFTALLRRAGVHYPKKR